MCRSKNLRLPIFTALILLCIVKSTEAQQQPARPTPGDRDVRLQLIAAGALAEDADRANAQQVIEAMALIRGAFKPAASDPVSIEFDRNLQVFASATNALEKTRLAGALERSELPESYRRVLSTLKDEFDRIFELVKDDEISVKFRRPDYLSKRQQDAEGWISKEAEGPDVFARISKVAGGIISGVDIYSRSRNTTSMLSTVRERFLTRSDRQREVIYEELEIANRRITLSLIRNVRKIVDGQEHFQQERVSVRSHVRGGHVVGLILRSDVSPDEAASVPESYSTLARFIVDHKQDGRHLTVSQQECLRKGNPSCKTQYVKIPDASAGQNMRPVPQRTDQLREVAWRLASNAVIHTIMSEFERDNGWTPIDVGKCDQGAATVSQPASTHTRVRIIAATDRKSIPTSSPHIDEQFSNEPRGALEFHCFLTDVPNDPKLRRKPSDKITGGYTVENRRFLGDAERGNELINLQEARNRRHGDRALVYVHGFKNTMSDALYRAAQIAAEMSAKEYGGRYYTYSWPSANAVVQYIDDLDRSEQAEVHLRTFIQAIARDPDIDSIDFVAHSMGAALVLKALSNIDLGFDKKSHTRIGQVILAAPDVNQRVFDTRLAMITPFASRITIYATERDRALSFRQMRYGGGPRMGLVGDYETSFKNVHVVDASPVMGLIFDNIFGHDYFVSNELVLRDIVNVLDTGQKYRTGDQDASLTERREKYARETERRDGMARRWMLRPEQAQVVDTSVLR